MECCLWILYSSYYDNEELNSAKKMLNKALEFEIKAELKFFDYFKIEEQKIFYKDEIVTYYPKVIFFRSHNI